MKKKKNQETRKEVDLLGKMEIPADAYYGIHTQRAVENFQLSFEKIAYNRHLIKSMILVKKASAKANLILGTLPKEVGKVIIEACDKILAKQDKYAKYFPIDVYQGGAGTSVNMNTNEVIANVALELMGDKKGNYKKVSPNDHVNRCQSTNDAYPTGLRLGAWYSNQELIAKVKYLAEGFEQKGKEFSNILKMGRTQLQDAVPMTLGQEFEAYAITLFEEINSLKLAGEMLLEMNLGATAIGTGINAPEGYKDIVLQQLREVTDLPIRGVKNLMEATSDTGAYVLLSGSLKRLAVKISKICNDLRLLSSGPRAGFNEINLPELQAGSSIMPAKVNPVMPEVINQVCYKVIGNDLTITMAAEAGQLQLNVMEPVISQSLFETLHLLKSSCLILREKCIDDIKANKEVCERYVYDSIGIITYLSPLIGHHKCDLVGKECAKTGKTVQQVLLEKKYLTQKEIDKVFNFENFLKPQYSAKRYH